MLDLDYFKPINDDFGHAAGDAALMMFTSLIRAEIRPGDVFARVGGDEFAIFFPRTPLEDVLKLVESIYARLARTPFCWDEAARTFSTSFGIAEARTGESPETLKRRADEALYEAKHQGRGRWVVANGAPHGAPPGAPAASRPDRRLPGGESTEERAV
jgi:diguanylate cyclase (GGDEF)-like protein